MNGYDRDKNSAWVNNSSEIRYIDAIACCIFSVISSKIIESDIKSFLKKAYP